MPSPALMDWTLGSSVVVLKWIWRRTEEAWISHFYFFALDTFGFGPYYQPFCRKIHSGPAIGEFIKLSLIALETDRACLLLSHSTKASLFLNFNGGTCFLGVWTRPSYCLKRSLTPLFSFCSYTEEFLPMEFMESPSPEAQEDPSLPCTIARGGPIFVPNLVGPLTRVTNFESSLLQLLQVFLFPSPALCS